MSKWNGMIGFADTVEIEPGIWNDKIIEKKYYGDILSNHFKYQRASDKINNDINVSVTISVLCDPYALEHLNKIAYVEYLGEKWTVSDVEPVPPRLNLIVGGKYNE